MITLPRTACEVVRLSVLLFLTVLSVSCASTTAISPASRAQLAPTGALRAAINLGNSVLAQKNTVSGELSGISVDLAHELGRRLDVPVEFVVFDAAGKVFDALKSDAWDVAFLAIDPARACC